MLLIENMKKTLAIAILIFMSSCTNYQKQAIVKQDIPVVSFSAQNQLDQTDNSMSWIVKQGIVGDDVHWGWKCSEDGDKSFLWLSQIDFTPSDIATKINVSSEYCE